MAATATSWWVFPVFLNIQAFVMSFPRRFSALTVENGANVWFHPLGTWIASLHWFDRPVLVAYRGILHWVNFDQTIVAYNRLKSAERFRVTNPPTADGLQRQWASVIISIKFIRGSCQYQSPGKCLKISLLNNDNCLRVSLCRIAAVTFLNFDVFEIGKWSLKHNFITPCFFSGSGGLHFANLVFAIYLKQNRNSIHYCVIYKIFIIII